ncbi:glycosyl transferase [Filimonas zeae]|uniref:Glycosyl transferase n=1 Tax=Filimonas zeae TaxID=1737353 RepID=A0A917J4S8_9BACT|nr:glycosyltransferase family 2 protein [Filimonas zeae]GGH80084.1 glycosyl transferase [Filimonas zeae]
MPSVSVITVNFNQSEVTEALLTSIRLKNSFKSLDIIVVDNGSVNNPVPAWKTRYPDIQFIRSDKNLGFAGGNNLAIPYAKGDYLFYVNNDTEFTEGLVEALVQTLEAHEEVAMVSPKIHYHQQPGLLQYAGFTEMNYYTARNACIGQFEQDKGQYDHTSGETGFAHGAAMMVKRAAIQKAGLMKESFFLYYEEMDWCARIKKAGFTIWVNTQALIYHKESVSVGANSPLKEFFMNRNRLLFIRRNGSFLQRLVFWNYFLLVVSPRNIIGYVKGGKPGFIRVLLKAIWWNVTNNVDSNKLGYPVQ